jgi:ABC-2 type transport system ATP-binding protein
MEQQAQQRPELIVFNNVSKFYGDVLGVNRVQLSIPQGITSLVGPNGSGKTTLMNLMTGLIRPTRGGIDVLGYNPDDPENCFRHMGYCTQFDSFPAGATGWKFIYGYLMVGGYSPSEAHRLTETALTRVSMMDAANRKIAAYSKGMRQRVKLAQAIAHQPEVLILDEPLNGLDPMARAEIIDLFRSLAEEGQHIVISSHILHEVDLISDRVVILNQGYVVADGDIRSVRTEIARHPMKVLVRCDKATLLASSALQFNYVVEIKMHDDRQGVLISTQDAEAFYAVLNRIILEQDINVESITPADEDVHAVYRYLVSENEEGENR